MDLQKFLTDLLVVIVLFRRKPEQSIAYSSLQTAFKILPQVPELLIYDNSPDSASTNDAMTYIHDPQNSGVSRAYNTASVRAGARSKKWMIFLDHDTRVEPALFQKLADATSKHPKSLAFVPRLTDEKGLVSPFYFASAKGRRIKVTTVTLPLDKYRFINSGLLISHSAFVAAGGYDENIPLDFSDICFGERLKKVTDHFRIIDITLSHGFSDNEKIPVEAALARFGFFCTGAMAMGYISGNVRLYFMRAFMHAWHLCFRYKDFRFVIRLFQQPIHG